VVLDTLKSGQGHLFSAPRFNEIRHAGVCSEVCGLLPVYTVILILILSYQLKSLYVAITRARKNMWIADCSERGEPMRVSLTL
jgi:hypothetical protein